MSVSSPAGCVVLSFVICKAIAHHQHFFFSSPLLWQYFESPHCAQGQSDWQACIQTKHQLVRIQNIWAELFSRPGWGFYPSGLFLLIQCCDYIHWYLVESLSGHTSLWIVCSWLLFFYFILNNNSSLSSGGIRQQPEFLVMFRSSCQHFMSNTVESVSEGYASISGNEFPRMSMASWFLGLFSDMTMPISFTTVLSKSGHKNHESTG